MPPYVLPAPVGGVNALHGINPGLAHGSERIKKGARLPNGQIASATTILNGTTIYMVHGINGNSALSCTAGVWGTPRSYLQGTHPGLGTDTIQWTGNIYLVGYYNGDSNCDMYLSTNNNPHGNFYAPSCNGVPLQEKDSWGNTQYIYNNDSRIETNNEPLEHIACVLSWQIYWTHSQYNENVDIVAHSMGGLIVRYMIERVQAYDSHFAPYLYISDAVTFSAPHGGIDAAQATAVAFACNKCYQNVEMVSSDFNGQSSPFMSDIYNHDHPNAENGTDWTMLGSLGADPLDWDYQATYMSNSGGISNNHRIGYNYPITCTGTTQYQYSNGYDHGAYMADACDAYDAPYYYCDGCSRDKHTYFYYTTGAPHSLHEMLFALVYNNW